MSKQENPTSDLRKSRFEKITFFFRYWREAFLVISICSSFLFLLNNLIASFFYQGGSHVDVNNPGYSFLWNYISDLGMTFSISGELNLVSRIIFTTTLVIVGFAALAFGIVFSDFYKKTNLSKFGTTILVFGVLNGITYMIIGFLPMDIYLLPHNVFVVFAFFFKLVLLILFILTILKDETIQMCMPIFI